MHEAKQPKRSRLSFVPALKEAGEDFEWYPTTDEIIAAFLKDVRKHAPDPYERRHGDSKEFNSLLDIGAGDGKVLEAVREAVKKDSDNADGKDSTRYSYSGLPFTTYFAIEKSAALRQRMPSFAFVIGTDFHEQTLIGKTASVIFCNPPYSEYVRWAVKIIRECAGRLAYLVIPEHWRQKKDIGDALNWRGVKAEVVGDFNFENAERRARCKVHLLRIDFSKSDAFAKTFADEFADYLQRIAQKKETAHLPENNRRKAFTSLVPGENYPAMLVNLYQEDMRRIHRNYQSAAALDVDLLEEFGIDPDKMMTGLREKLTGLRSVYWKELFGRMGLIVQRLTSKSREALLAKLHANENVDFTVSNIHAVIVWALKNSNDFMDSQLLDCYEKMLEKANVQNYKSNDRVFNDRWRYENQPEPSQIYLDYRIVLAYLGGWTSEGWRSMGGLEERAGEFLQDLLTVANNIGFSTSADSPLFSRGCSRNESENVWKPGGAQEFFYSDGSGTLRVLFRVRAFKNRNLHIQLDQRFVLALNIEYGRLKGWLRSGSQAREEMKAGPEAEEVFGKTFRLPFTTDPARLLS